MTVNRKALEKYYEDKRMSASWIKEFSLCPKKYFYNKIEKLPEMDHDYFNTWKRVEEEVYRMLWENMEWYDDVPNMEEKTMAKEICEFKPFQKLIEGKGLKFQVEHYAGTLKWLTDLETDTDVIDIKTSATDWTPSMVEESKWQAILYTKLTGKRFHFVIVNKKTLKCQLITVPVSEKGLEDLAIKEDELALAIELGIFQPNPSYRCRFCDFRNVCDADRKETQNNTPLS